MIECIHTPLSLQLSLKKKNNRYVERRNEWERPPLLLHMLLTPVFSKILEMENC